MRRSRRECLFVSDHTVYSRKLSNGELDQIERHAITLEKATRPKGCKNGTLGQCALDVLRTLRRKFYQHGERLMLPKRREAPEGDGRGGLSMVPLVHFRGPGAAGAYRDTETDPPP